MNPYLANKVPIGHEWGQHTIDADDLATRLAANPALNVGIALGPEMGYIDFECDGEAAKAHYLELFADISTPSWSSLRAVRPRRYLHRPMRAASLIRWQPLRDK